MFYLRYLLSELRRRRGRTILTALGLGVGVGLVVTVTALSAGLDDAQSKVLDPLTGVGTDMSVTRPLQVSGSGPSQSFGPPGAGGAGLSKKEQKELQRENGGGRFGLENLGKPGRHFERDDFVTTNLSFPAKAEQRVASIDGVDGVASALTLSAIRVSGTVPKSSGSAGRGFVAPAPGGPPSSINLNQRTVSGVDVSQPHLGLLTRSQITRGSYFQGSGRNQAVLSTAYANENDLGPGDEVTVGGHHFEVVGTATSTVGGRSSDIYVQLEQLQRLSDHRGRVNVLDVRVVSSDRVASVAAGIRSALKGSQVTTAQDLADQVSGSLVDAKDLAGKLGTALAAVALLAAFGIATLLTLSSVNKRTRELGTLKAIGWRQWLVVRQISGESLVQGLLGGLAGVAIGVAGAAIIGAIGISLDASLAPQQSGPAPGPPGFGQGAVNAVSSTVTLGAPVSAEAILLAIALAALGGLVAGSVGGLRAARLRPAEALRSVE
jgi:ABC-type antimicrobial peptide transport system permease subunit